MATLMRTEAVTIVAIGCALMIGKAIQTSPKSAAMMPRMRDTDASELAVDAHLSRHDRTLGFFTAGAQPRRPHAEVAPGALRPEQRPGPKPAWGGAVLACADMGKVSFPAPGAPQEAESPEMGVAGGGARCARCHHEASSG